MLAGSATSHPALGLQTHSTQQLESIHSPEAEAPSPQRTSHPDWPRASRAPFSTDAHVSSRDTTHRIAVVHCAPRRHAPQLAASGASCTPAGSVASGALPPATSWWRVYWPVALWRVGDPRRPLPPCIEQLAILPTRAVTSRGLLGFGPSRRCSLTTSRSVAESAARHSMLRVFVVMAVRLRGLRCSRTRTWTARHDAHPKVGAAAYSAEPTKVHEEARKGRTKSKKNRRRTAALQDPEMAQSEQNAKAEPEDWGPNAEGRDEEEDRRRASHPRHDRTPAARPEPEAHHHTEAHEGRAARSTRTGGPHTKHTTRREGARQSDTTVSPSRQMPRRAPRSS
jgi:hypothetical protein